MFKNDKITITYDRENDVAYIHLSSIADGEITDTRSFDDLPQAEGELNFDFSKEQVLKGIEITSASKILSTKLLESAKDPR
jgi:uncharacterized protein YuzE